MALVRRELELVGRRRRLRIPAQSLPIPCTVHVSGSDGALNAALALAWLDFPRDFLAETGFALAAHPEDPAPRGDGCHYIGPHFRWEVSGFWSTVADEIAMGAKSPRAAWLEEIIRVLRLDPLLSRDPGQLSGGETAKVILAAHLAHRPRHLVLDRVLGELDGITRAEVMRHLGRWVPGGIVMVTDDSITAGFDRAVATDGDVAAWSLGAALPLAGPDPLHESLTLENVNATPGDPAPRIRLEKFTALREVPVFPPVDCAAAAGQFVLVRGANGSGKTSLLEGMAGLLRSEGRIAAWANGGPVAANRAFAFSPQDPLCDITELDIERELALACGDAGSVPGLLNELDFPPHLLHEPLHEEVGLQKLTSVVAATLRGRPACLLDEPTIYLGRALRPVAERAILRYLAKGGVVFCSSHDGEFVHTLRSRLR